MQSSLKTVLNNFLTIMNIIYSKSMLLNLVWKAVTKSPRGLGQGQADILLGTQMIASGPDFPNVTLALCLMQTQLNLPGFSFFWMDLPAADSGSRSGWSGWKAGKSLYPVLQPSSLCHWPKPESRLMGRFGRLWNGNSTTVGLSALLLWPVGLTHWMRKR